MILDLLLAPFGEQFRRLSRLWGALGLQSVSQSPLKDPLEPSEDKKCESYENINIYYVLATFAGLQGACFRSLAASRSTPVLPGAPFGRRLGAQGHLEIPPLFWYHFTWIWGSSGGVISESAA